MGCMLSYGLYTCAALLMHTVFPFCHMYLLVYLSYVLTPHTLTGICYMYKNPIQQIHSHLHKWVPFHVECLFLYGCLLSDFMVFLLLTLSPHTHTLTLIAHHILTSSHPNLPPPLLIPSPPHSLPSSPPLLIPSPPHPLHDLFRSPSPPPPLPSPSPPILIPSPPHPLPSSSPPLLIYLLLHPSSPPYPPSSPPSPPSSALLSGSGETYLSICIS